MGFFDIFKSKPDGPKNTEGTEQKSAPQPAASPQPASAPTPVVFEVKFGEKSFYPEPGLDTVGVAFGYSGVAEVSCENGSGSSAEVGLVRSTILNIMETEIKKFGTEQSVSINDLPAHSRELSTLVTKGLKEKGFETHSFSIISLGPTESGKELLRALEMKRKVESMTPEELGKMMEENARKAQEIYDRMTPEEQEEARRNAERRMAEEQAKHDKLMAEIQAIREKRSDTDSRGSGNIPITPPKFCTSCGSPVTGGKFCTNCGAPLES